MKLSTRLARVFSSGLGTGFSPRASGTVASAAAALVWYYFASSLSSGAPLPKLEQNTLALSLITFALGLVATHLLINDQAWRTMMNAKQGDANNHKQHLDPREVVIDEWAGMFAALVAASPTIIDLVMAFALFRAFDIIKPGPVGAAEKIPGALGIMLDDLVGGFAAALVLFGIHLVLR